VDILAAKTTKPFAKWITTASTTARAANTGMPKLIISLALLLIF